MKKYYCSDCGIELDEGEGSVFTCCEICWDKHYKKTDEAKRSQVEKPVILPKASLQNEQIDVWRIEAKGIGSSYYEHDISIVEDMLKSCDYDDGYIITKHQMNKKEYESLPEFQGF